ncbi:MAG: RagB/SusD family nutrient uptake outer membrane protein [Bacteroidota bacterium]|nr:RagB/SusD family nutrient uptake outer membrane protein [Bacteroidota bacterium]
MKKYIVIFFAIVASGLFTSCNDQLDLQTDGRISMSEVFTDRYRTMGYLNSCYGHCPGPYMDRASLTDEAEDADDNTSGSRYNPWYNGAVTASNYGSFSTDGSPYEQVYQGIRKCNVFLANIWTSTAYATDEEKKGWAAQAHTLRALYYLQLIKRYGNVVIYDKPLEINHDFSKDKKSKFSEVVKFIMADCDSALAAPATQNGFPWEVYNNQFGIMTRAVPYAIKSEAVTYAASPLFSDGTFSWADATAINKEALYQCLTHDYKLFDVQPVNNAAQNAYALYFITNSNDQRSVDKETIYQGGGQMSVWRYAGLPTTYGMNKAGPCPTQDLVDSYEMANGESPILGYSDADHLQPIINSASGYDPANPYEGRDPRFYASIYYNGAIRDLNPPTAGMKFTATAPFYAVNAKCPSWSNNIGNLTMTLYKWSNSYSESVNGTPIKSVKFPDYADNEWLTLSFDTPLPAGDYVWVLGDGSETVGVWKWTDGDPHTTCLSYYSGAQVSGNYQSDISYNGTDFVDLVSGASNVTPVQITPPKPPVRSYVGGEDGISQIDRTHTRTGYYQRKFNNYQSGNSNEADGAIRLFRLSELYLNFAESAYQSNNPDAQISLGAGITMSARDAVNAIRARAGMPGLKSGMSKTAFETKYRNERRIELAFEEHRFFDVRRWKILKNTDAFVTGMKITPNGSGLTYTRFKFANRNCSSDKWLLYPVPQDEATKMFGFTGVSWQNTGW